MSQGLGTLGRMKTNTVVFLFNNGVRGIDQWSGNPKVYKGDEKIDCFNEVPRWKYDKFVESIGGTYYQVETPEHLLETLKKLEKSDCLTVVDIKLKQKDVPELARWRFK